MGAMGAVGGAASVAMPWVGLGVSVLGTAASLIGGNSAKREQKALQERALRQQQEQLDFTKNAYNEEKGFINPIREDLRKEYFTDSANSPGFIRAKAEIESGADAALRANDQNMEAMGMTGSAADSASRVTTLLKKASSLGDARLRGELSKADLGFKLLSTDKSMPLLGAMQGANQGVAGTYQGMAQQAGADKAAWNQAAGSLASAGIQAMLTNRTGVPTAKKPEIDAIPINQTASMPMDLGGGFVQREPVPTIAPQQVPQPQPVTYGVNQLDLGTAGDMSRFGSVNFNSWGAGFTPKFAQ